MACKGCKNKPLQDLNTTEVVKGKKEKLVFILIIIYTILTGYGLISLILDIKNLFI